MKLIHIADTHLGFRSYARNASGGRNQREVDVEQSFSRVIDATIAAKPDLILFAGDIFHMPRPSNPTILHAMREMRRLREELQLAHMVMVAGNHDRPRTQDSRCLLTIFEQLNVKVAVDQPDVFRCDDATVLAVPEGLRKRPDLRPRDADARFNVLLLHGEIEGVIRNAHQRPSESIAVSEISDDRWSYIALGHYHSYTKISERAFYAGSIDYTSSDIWSESRLENGRGKGIIEHDLASGAHRFIQIEHARKVIDLPLIDAKGLSASKISDLILERAESIEGGIDDQIARLKIIDIEKHVIRDLDHRMVRKLQHRALYFALDPRRPNEDALARGDAPPKVRVSLADFVKQHLETRPLPEGIEREAFVAAGMKYLEAGSAKEKLSLSGEQSMEK